MTHYQRKQRRSKKRGSHKARNTVLVGSGVLLGLLAIAAISVVGYVISIAATTPNIDELKPIDKGATSAVYAANGRLLGYVRSSIIRQPVVEDDIPQDARNATVAIEDNRFYKHHGVDFQGVVRAAIKNLYGLAELPDKVTGHRIAEPWKPYSSIGAWYCWRSLEFAKE